jgi:mitochondrial import receptor subunit TOM20
MANLMFLIAYAVYFDYQRRKNPDFRKTLRREERRQVRAEKEEAVAQSKEKRRGIQAAVDAALEEGFPTGVNEKEQYFMEYVQQGETLASDRKPSLIYPPLFYLRRSPPNEDDKDDHDRNRNNRNNRKMEREQEI